ncbi:hypothetical protein RCO48_13140 [Peribacillus frigoritolerans]|nr:hypothetical protein [Peribacillus frigoritolerans]
MPILLTRERDEISSEEKKAVSDYFNKKEKKGKCPFRILGGEESHYHPGGIFTGVSALSNQCRAGGHAIHE